MRAVPQKRTTFGKFLTSKLFVPQEPEYLTVANGIFADKAFDLSADYENQARNYLKSEVRMLDFAGNPSAGESEINEWTKNKTNGKISKILDQGN